MQRLCTALLVVALAASPTLAQNGKGAGSNKPSGGPTTNGGQLKDDQQMGTNGNGNGFGTVNNGNKGSNSNNGKGSSKGAKGSGDQKLASAGLFGGVVKAEVVRKGDGSIEATASIFGLKLGGGSSSRAAGAGGATAGQPGQPGQPGSQGSSTSPGSSAPEPPSNTPPGRRSNDDDDNDDDDDDDDDEVAMGGIDPQPPSGSGPDPIPPPEEAFAEPTEVDDTLTPPEFIDLLFNQPKDIRLQLSVPRYGYFKGLVYSKGLVRMIGQIRVIGGVVAAGEDSAVALRQGAMATSNPDAFNNRVKTPVHRMRIVEWKETGN